MGEALQKDLAWCRDQVLTPDSLLSVTLRFADTEAQSDLLILHAVLRSIRAIPFEVSQPEPAMAKLGWWQQELMDPGPQASQHPAARALHDSGVFARVNETDLAAFIQAVACFASGEPVEDQGGLLRHAEGIGGSAAKLEQSLTSGHISDSVIVAGVTDFMCWCLGNFERKLVGSCWWLPLDGQAKFGQSAPEGRVNGEQNRNPEILGFQAQEAIKSIDKLASQSPPETSAKRVASHLYVSSAVNRYRLTRLARNPSRYWPIRNRPWDIVVAWRAARSHQRQNQQAGKASDDKS